MSCFYSPALRFGLLLSLVAFVVQGCDQSSLLSDESAPAQPSLSISSAMETYQGLRSNRNIVTIDEELADIALEVPEFGGYFYDETGQFTVYLTDMGKQAEITTLLQGRAGDGIVPDVESINVIRGEYSFVQIYNWGMKLLDPVFHIEGVQGLDLKEGSNRVVVQTTDLATEDEIYSVVAEYGVPEEAVLVEKTTPGGRRGSDLTAWWGTIRGGIQVQTENQSSKCTLGVLAEMVDQVNYYFADGFVTATHCTRGTNDFSGVRDDQLHSPQVPLDPTDDTIIGFEKIDPEWFTNAEDSYCPSGYDCRYSDAAFFERDIEGNRTYDKGKIWRTSGVGSTNVQDPPFAISGWSSSTEGEQVDQIGRYSGWQTGTVTNTCVKKAYPIKDIAILCTSVASVSNHDGDSGAPVFHRTGNYITCNESEGPCEQVILRGILWGGADASTMWYSEWSAVDSELGDMGVALN